MKRHHWRGTSARHLVWIYDNNHITIEGNTALAFSEDVAARFLGYHWHVQRVGDANDTEQLEAVFARAIHEDQRPSLIIVDSHIAYGAPHKQDTSAAHGEPLGEEESVPPNRAMAGIQTSISTCRRKCKRAWP